MKPDINTRIILLILLCCLIVSCSHINNEADIYGNWQGAFKNKDISINFNADKTCVLKFTDRKTNQIDTYNGVYEPDFTKMPIPLTIRNIPQLNHPLHTIIEFVGDDSMKMAGFSPRWRLRPISFDEGKTINLKRIIQYNAESL
ncbi:hypothetical protein JXQ31_14355 [candidate division KSB1 bacterium]|nr:hypothetical protein [candidate division KSB1 bacterium]